uniref:LOW QUALITY PROTEIN: E3 ubiquitin-protein ligase TRIM7-like n=1 Tax=Euleptes europaea TaxID=460621 RepID=UPI002541AEB5|nr:LOW QUALITY PROTEIN: E3 ubiquitin-protein ligase TRIM7-like [Euleptes europaea]
MAAGGPVQELCEEVTCPICLEHFQDPMIIAECGHNFCRACLARYWREASAAAASCPVCQQSAQPGHLRPNRQLANVVEIAKKLSLQGERGAESKGGVCEKHREPLKLFCKDDGAPICVVCDRSKEHRDHRVIPVEEAAEEYKPRSRGSFARKEAPWGCSTTKLNFCNPTLTAAGGPVQELCEEVTCPILLEHFQDPMIIAECGHNFCRACLARCWREPSAARATCPVCKQSAQPRNLNPNRQLANVVEVAKKLSLQVECGVARKGAEGKGGVCEKHQEPLKLFCKDDEAPICVVCDRSKEHRDHRVIPVEEAAEESKDKLRGYVEILRKERDKILARKADTEKETQGMLEQTEYVREKSAAEFRKLRQFLEEQEQRLLAQVEEVEKEIARERDQHLARLSVELSSLESLIQEMREKIQQPATELLQDIKSTLERYKEKEEFGNLVTFYRDLIWRINKIDNFLEADLKQFKDAMSSELQLQEDKLNVTLDPDTAHPKLFLSEDRKSVRLGKKDQRLPNNPERFDEETVVLGREGFPSGRHFWEVAVEGVGKWAVGVARKSVRRKGAVIFSPEGGIWAVGKISSYYMAFSHPERCVLDLNGKLKRILVALDFAGERVDFSDPDTAAPLYTFKRASFQGETLFPFFYIFGEGYLRLSRNLSTGAYFLID